MRKLFLLVIPSLLSLILIYKVQYFAYIYASIVWLAFCLVMIFQAKNEIIKLFYIYFGSIVLAFSLAEIYTLANTENEFFNQTLLKQEVKINYGGYNTYDDQIGLIPTKNSQRNVRLKYGDSLIYEVTQTIDQYSRRIMPLNSIANPNKAVLFFGCSFTFGSGVEDHEAMPYQFQKISGGEYKAINYGYASYGAHQMLAMLEHKKEQQGIKGYQPKFAIYQFITDHVFRGTESSQELVGPKYRFDEKGKLKKESTYSLDMISRNINKYQYYIKKSILLSNIFFHRTQSHQNDINLLVAMIQKSADIFESRYHGKFYCLFWEEKWSEVGLYEKILKRLKDKHINVIEMEEIIPGYTEHYDPYILYKDEHPNSKAHQKIAEYLTTFLKRDKKLSQRINIKTSLNNE